MASCSGEEGNENCQKKERGVRGVRGRLFTHGKGRVVAMVVPTRSGVFSFSYHILKGAGVLAKFNSRHACCVVDALGVGGLGCFSSVAENDEGWLINYIEQN